MYSTPSRTIPDLFLRSSLVQEPQQVDGLLENFTHDWTTKDNLDGLHLFLDTALLAHGTVNTSISVQAKLALLLEAMYDHQDYQRNRWTLTHIERLVGLSNLGFDLLTLFAQYGYNSSVQWLLENSHMNVNAQDSRGVEPLMAACLGGHLSVMELLCTIFGANPCLYTTNGQTLLMVACQAYLTRREPRLSNIVDWLLNDVRIDVDEKDENEMTALHIAIGHSRDGGRSWMHQAILNDTFFDELNQAQDVSIHVNEAVGIIRVPF